jgi:hypothetical protein
MGFLQNAAITLLISITTFISGVLGVFHLSQPQAVPPVQTTSTTTRAITTRPQPPITSISKQNTSTWLLLQKAFWTVSYPTNLTVKDHPTSQTILISEGTLSECRIIINYMPLSERVERDELSALMKTGHMSDVLQAILEFQKLSIYIQPVAGSDKTEFISSRIYKINETEAAEFVSHSDSEWLFRTTFAKADNLIDINLLCSVEPTSNQRQLYNFMLQSFRFS